MSNSGDNRAKTSSSSSGENIRSKHEQNIESTSNSPIIGKLKSSSVPTTKICNVLQELQDDIVSECPHNNRTGDFIYHISTSEITPKTGLSEFYVEHNGRFTKACKDVPEQDMDNGLRYFQAVDPEISYNTPLDIAIYTQKIWNVMSKILFGLLSGIAVYDLIILHFQLDTSKNWEQNQTFLELYSSLSFLITKFYHITLTICLITLFDWFDLAHMNVRHLADTFKYRKIWIVTLIYFIAISVAMYNFSSDDIMILYDNIKDNLKDKENSGFTLYMWMVAKKICCWSCIIGWIILIVTNNEDLFLIHLLAMKKYDYDEDQVNQVFENVNAIS